MKALHMISFTLVVVGGLNWGLIGLFNFNLVNTILGSVGGLEQLVYVLVGVSAVILMLGHKNDCKICSGK
ncbi:MAG: DUF378 domain-containing protein [Candidatus Levybacteria bacterium]|nr:DUF378 domain-containing protein [Candidatus Levybacteria bacterium]